MVPSYLSSPSPAPLEAWGTILILLQCITAHFSPPPLSYPSPDHLCLCSGEQQRLHASPHLYLCSAPAVSTQPQGCADQRAPLTQPLSLDGSHKHQCCTKAQEPWAAFPTSFPVPHLGPGLNSCHLPSSLCFCGPPPLPVFSCPLALPFHLVWLESSYSYLKTQLL